MFYSGHLNLSAPRGIAAETLCRTHRCAESLSAGSIGLGYLVNSPNPSSYPAAFPVLSGTRARSRVPTFCSVAGQELSFGGSGQDHAARGTPQVSAKGGAVPPPNTTFTVRPVSLQLPARKLHKNLAESPDMAVLPWHPMPDPSGDDSRIGHALNRAYNRASAKPNYPSGTLRQRPQLERSGG